MPQARLYACANHEPAALPTTQTGNELFCLGQAPG